MKQSASHLDWHTGSLRGPQICESVKKLGQLAGLFRDQNAWRTMDPETVVYRVQWWEPIPQSTQGGLFWGATTIEPGRVNDEYFMTHGHFHSIRDRAEYYCTVKGDGVLVLMGEDRLIRTENMSLGSLHYIPGSTAHRVVNTSETPLVFWASWPSDAGHDYDTIRKEGFAARILLRDGAPTIVPEKTLDSGGEIEMKSGWV
jgi:glucose-6-phosphate isomerase, archaeal